VSAYVGCVGCEQRHLDAERVRAFLRGNGIEVVAEPRDAELIVLVTCAVDGRSEAASVAELERLVASRSSNSRLVVGGCLPSISPGRLAQFDVLSTFSPRTLGDMEKLLPGRLLVPMRDVPDANVVRVAPAGVATRDESTTPREEYDAAKAGFTIRIDHGCLLSCTYCVIQLATGRLESVPEDEIVRSFARAVDDREPTIMLVGGDTGAWGLDAGSRFSELLARLLSFQGSHRLFIHDFNANWLIRDMENFARILRGGSENLRALCVPVQSGSDAVLRQMRRPYTADDVRRVLRWIRAHAPHVAIGTHIIIGFPGEGESDFDSTMQLLRDVDFDFVTCFRYSEHPSARSAVLASKVPADVATQRLALVKALLGDRVTVIG
jgi:MiaB/RimO family radical SAM methylthiotransferase